MDYGNLVVLNIFRPFNGVIILTLIYGDSHRPDNDSLLFEESFVR